MKMEWKAEWQELKRQWSLLGVYDKFEQAVALTLTFLISVIIVVALVELTKEIVLLVVRGASELLEYKIFQSIFGQIMTLLIALEFKHSILKMAQRGESIIQAKTVFLIALMALARKFIILDIQQTSAGTIAALAAAVLTLSAGYWLVRDRSTPAARGAGDESSHLSPGQVTRIAGGPREG
ncbi:phosphate-starvation-inducible PsiE family protein [Pelomicrobium sp. G1]|uniref:phosphate-starvation-inducible PsiE family protein n=1 Tax=unclassified Pelomicrobium TaxID=2815318 RepID=UPI0021DE85A7|nr:MAG: hypothetical protein KatS3mg123_2871 [Burkholderiales bacterium]